MSETREQRILRLKMAAAVAQNQLEYATHEHAGCPHCANDEGSYMPRHGRTEEGNRFHTASMMAWGVGCLAHGGGDRPFTAAQIQALQETATATNTAFRMEVLAQRSQDEIADDIAADNMLQHWLSLSEPERVLYRIQRDQAVVQE